jgi:sigma-54 dependent transcriptional regulator, acetoin dehydrogenase operon transcriptional activator AcoR
MSIKDILSTQENLAHVLDNLKVGIIAHDLNRRIFYFNREAEHVTGYNREEVLGKDCHQALGRPFCGDNCSFCGQAPLFLNAEELSESKEYTVQFVSRSGANKTIELSATLMRDSSNKAVGILASFRDITELIELKKQAQPIKGFGNIIGKDSKMRMLFQQIEDVSAYDFPVHISGETGTGKELVANAIHSKSRFKEGPFVPINCGALPEGLIESELFGHVKGAFSGAVKTKKGRFELADGGTIFLDEVAELKKSLQVKLLRFLQEGTFYKVGGEKTVRVNVRVISATNKNLKKEVQNNHFREDLFYRLNVIPVHIPPLRERKTDIPLLTEFFLNQVNQNGNKPIFKFSNSAMAKMLDYAWPGNVRELQNAVQFSIVRTSGSVITEDDLPLELRQLTCFPTKRGPACKLETASVRSALISTSGNKARAARHLGVGRATLYRFLSEHPEAIPDD